MRYCLFHTPGSYHHLHSSLASSSNLLIPSNCSQSADVAIGSGEFLSPPYARVRCISLLYLLRISKVPRLINRFRVCELSCFHLIAFLPSSLTIFPPPLPPLPLPLFPLFPSECVSNCRIPHSLSKSSWLFLASFGSFGFLQHCRSLRQLFEQFLGLHAFTRKLSSHQSFQFWSCITRRQVIVYRYGSDVWAEDSGFHLLALKGEMIMMKMMMTVVMVALLLLLPTASLMPRVLLRQHHCLRSSRAPCFDIQRIGALPQLHLLDASNRR